MKLHPIDRTYEVNEHHSIDKKTIDEVTARELIGEINPNAKYISFGLYENKITEEGAKVLATAFLQNTSLTSLCLDKNMSEGGALLAFEGVIASKGLEKLTIINQEGVKEILSHLAKRKDQSLTSLSLSSNKLNNEAMEELKTVLDNSTTLKDLTLQSNDMDVEAVKLLATALQENKTIKELSLLQNKLQCDAGAGLINKALCKNTTWEVLELRDNLTTGDKRDHLITTWEFLKPNDDSITNNDLKTPNKSPSLRTLKFNFQSWDELNARAVAQALSSNKYITELCLVRNHFGENVQWLAEILNNNSSLKKLVLERGEIESHMLRDIGLAVNLSTSITTLEIAGLELGDEGAEMLVQALIENKSLINLKLNSNKIYCKGAEAIAKLLKQNTTLEVLDINHNSMGDNGIKAIAESLKQNTSLKSVSFGNNRYDYNGAMRIIDTLKNNTTLVSLNFEPHSCMKELKEVLEKNASITHLDISGITIEGRRFKLLSEAINKCYNLLEVELRLDETLSEPWIQEKKISLCELLEKRNNKAEERASSWRLENLKEEVQAYDRLATLSRVKEYKKYQSAIATKLGRDEAVLFNNFIQDIFTKNIFTVLGVSKDNLGNFKVLGTIMADVLPQILSYVYIDPQKTRDKNNLAKVISVLLPSIITCNQTSNSEHTGYAR
ncbi:MAG: leucine-rich repeat-containing protein 34 [Candidatus Midichloriaceae bacterium]|jgi:Ran GTPase-activating protein (RanGAP) involved in mRNA processing and transport|nr:leucine-rich repeat-containing protein 34 [Candidatus Midichloriaceae bacterium]